MIIITTKVHPVLLDTLTSKGYKYLYEPTLEYAELYDIIPKATGIIIATQINIDSAMIDRAIDLEWIGRLGSGMEHVDVAYAMQRGIRCESSPEGNRTAVAEHALGLLLSLLRNISKSYQEVRQKQWYREENRGVELSGKTIGIIGFGNTGSSFAKLLSSFGVKILAFDKYKKVEPTECISSSTITQIQQEADIISFHLPLTTETRHIANDDFFQLLQRRPYIINTSRGGIVDTQSLVQALKNKQISGVGLDVLENEKLQTYQEREMSLLEYLSKQNNVIITPHIAGYSNEAVYKLSAILMEKLGIS